MSPSRSPHSHLSLVRISRLLIRDGCGIGKQAECLWLHLPVIKEVAGMCKEVFQGGQTAYAYCTISTYPSGQIGAWGE